MALNGIELVFLINHIACGGKMQLLMKQYKL